jgi:hypothetical protein
MAEEFPQVTVTPRTRSADPKLLSRRQVLRAAGGLGAVGAATLMSRHADAAPTRAPFVVRQRFQDQITIEVWDQQQSDKNIQDAYNAALTAFQ